MKWSNIPAGELDAAWSRLRVAFGDKADSVVWNLLNDEAYTARLADFAVNPPFVSKMMSSINPQWLRAREIMGENFFGAEEAGQHFGVSGSRTTGPREFQKLAKIPFSEEVLIDCKDTHILVAVFPLSLLDLLRVFEAERFTFRHSFLDGNPLLMKKGAETGWYLLPKKLDEKFFRKDWGQQNKERARYQEVLSTSVVVYVMAASWLHQRAILYKDHDVRTVSTTYGHNNTHVSVCLGSGGLLLSDIHDTEAQVKLGLAVCRKPL